MTKILTTFFSVLLVGLSPLFSADERARKKEEVRQELLSIQAALDEMKGGSPEIRFPPEREPEPELPPASEVKAVEPPAEASEVEQVESELQTVQAGLDQLNRESERFSSGLRPFSKPPEPVTVPDPVIPPAPQLPVRPVFSEPVPVRKPTGGPGVYIVPAIALVHSSGFDFKSGSGFEIEEDLGGGASLRTGWMWDDFFTDLHLTYARSDLESIDLGGAPLTFSGDTEFFGFHLTGGGKVGLLDKLKLPFGLGVGGGRQEISMMLGNVPFSESDFVLTYHLFAGLEYFATDNLLFGMRYRLVNLGEMSSFSNRALQMLEFSCGYQY
jgi:opacity protein-like surface antigen